MYLNIFIGQAKKKLIYTKIYFFYDLILFYKIIFWSFCIFTPILGFCTFLEHILYIFKKCFFVEFQFNESRITK